MAKPVVVIIGRPNVGKSTLFNRIVGSRAAIVEDIPGVTRDRNYMDAEWEGNTFVVVDTGGFYPQPEDDIFGQIKEQALFAVDEADLIIHLLDGKEGMNPYDKELSALLRASGKKVLWAVNKIDAPTKETRLYEFYDLGVDELIPVSATTGYNFDELMHKVISLLPPAPKETTDYPKIAVIGRPNVGKSTLINALIGKKRLLVSPIPGTTRDSIDSICTYYGKKYLLIDTAGIRRKAKAGYSLERFAMLRAMRSIERCDVSLLLIDASEGVVAEDQKIAGMAHRYEKGIIFLINKWDLVQEPDKAYKQLLADIKRKLWFLDHAPVLTTSGLKKKRITKLFPLIDEVIKERRKRISTAELNRFLKDITLPTYKGKTVKLYYMTQVGTEPPAFSIFTNLPEGIKDAHIRYIETRLREKYSFKGTPIKIYIRQKK
jgi:GTP-binding protein